MITILTTIQLIICWHFIKIIFNNKYMNTNFTLTTAVPNLLSTQAQLITNSFGLSLIKPKFFQKTTGLNSPYSEQDNQKQGQKNAANNIFGLPLFGALTLAGNQANGNLNYETLDGQQVSVAPIILPIVLFEIVQEKHIVKTSIVGRNGTIKEYCSDGDYQINIKGMLTSNANDVYPSNEVTALLDFLRAPVDIVATSDILQLFGITNIVVDSYRFDSIEGNRSVVPFEITCLSEPAYEISPANQ